MEKIKRNVRMWAVPILAISASLWLWSQYGNEGLWWWPAVIVIVFLAKMRVYLRKQKKENEKSA